MSDANTTHDAEETFDKLIAARVPSELAERIETLSDCDFSEEVRAGLRLRRRQLEDEHNQLRTDGGTTYDESTRECLFCEEEIGVSGFVAHVRNCDSAVERDDLMTDGGRDVGRDERRSLVPVSTKLYEVHDAAADVAHDAIEHGDLDPAEVADALRDAADEVERTDVEDDLMTDGGLAVGATATGPHTAPPTTRFGEPLSRYAEYLAETCPECGEIGIDVWIHEGATMAGGVCVACDATLDEDELDDVRRSA